MTNESAPIRLFDLLAGLSGALDLMSPEVVGHHKRVAAIAAAIGGRLGLAPGERGDLCMAALLHDVGGFTRQSRLAALQFEADGGRHAELGYRLLRTNPLLKSAAAIVRHHHTPYSRFPGLAESPRTLLSANVLCLADRVDTLFLRYGADPPAILERLLPLEGRMFAPEPLAALRDLARDAGFWTALASGGAGAEYGAEVCALDRRSMSRGQLIQASGAFSQIIDFRSRFTATHSRGVSATAVRLAELAGMDAAGLADMRLAGDLHDLGKLAVPAEILDKPGPLTPEERTVINRHPQVTGDILAAVPGLGRVRDWAREHHEQPCGGGYPQGLAGEALPWGSRLLSAADVFTALREDRPYRAGLPLAKSLDLMNGMGAAGQLDPAAVDLVRGDAAGIDGVRAAAQARAAEDFRRFYADLPRE